MIKKSVSIFFEKKNLIYFLKIYSPIAPFAVINAIQSYLIKINYPLFSWVSGAFLLIGAVSLLVYFFVGLAGIYAVQGVVSGNTLSIKGVYQAAWANLWKFSLLAILIFLITVGGTLLLIIPGIIFGVWFTFSNFIFVEKNPGIKASLTASKKIVSGRFWQVLGRIIVFGIFFVLVQIVTSIIPFGIGSILTEVAGALFILPSFLLYKQLNV